MADFDFDLFQRQTADAVARICRGGCSLRSLVTELQRLCDSAEAVIERDGDGDRSLIACASGCGSCCVVNVASLFPEGLAIADFIAALPKIERTALIKRLENLWRVIRGLDDEERLAVRQNCAFLSRDGSCVIYLVRPLLCRSITSTDAEACQNALSGKIFAGEQPVLMYKFRQELYQVLFRGFGAGLEQAGLDGRSFQVSGLVRFLLQHPGRQQQLLAGARLNWEELY